MKNNNFLKDFKNFWSACNFWRALEKCKKPTNNDFFKFDPQKSSRSQIYREMHGFSKFIFFRSKFFILWKKFLKENSSPRGPKKWGAYISNLPFLPTIIVTLFLDFEQNSWFFPIFWQKQKFVQTIWGFIRVL